MSSYDSQAVPVDLDRINDATGGDSEFLAELVEIFIEDAQLRLEEISGAVASGDPEELKKTAHKLKGSSANMGANQLMGIAKTLEDMGNRGETSDASGHMPNLEAEFVRVKDALNAIVAEGA